MLAEHEDLSTTGDRAEANRCGVTSINSSTVTSCARSALRRSADLARTVSVIGRSPEPVT